MMFGTKRPPIFGRVIPNYPRKLFQFGIGADWRGVGGRTRNMRGTELTFERIFFFKAGVFVGKKSDNIMKNQLKDV